MTTQSGRLESLALAAVLAIGAGIVWLFAIAFGFNMVQEAFFPRYRVGEQIVVQSNGTPVVKVFQERSTSYRSFDGKHLDLVGANNIMMDCQWIRRPHFQGLVGSSWSRRITHLSTHWYFVHDGALHGHGYFIGYDPVTKLPIGCVGRNGFRPDKPIPEEQFPVDSHNMPLKSAQAICHLVYSEKQPSGRYRVSNRDLLYLVTRDGLVQIDLKARTVNVVRRDASLISVVALNGTILARTPNRILALDRDGKEVGAYSLPAELRNADLKWYQLGKDKALVQAGWDGNDLFWLDATGKIVRRERVDLHTVSRETNIVDHMATLLNMPSPVVIVAFLPVTLMESQQSQDNAIGYFAVFGRALNRAWPRLLFVGGISIFLAWLSYRRQRKYGLPWTGVWTGFVLLFGLPAYFGYLAHRAWPARLACPNCGKRVPRDRPACFACGREFPPPARKGIEVFA